MRLGLGNVRIGISPKQYLNQNTGRGHAPTEQLALLGELVDRGAHERYRAVRISQPGLLTRQADVEDLYVAEVARSA